MKADMFDPNWCDEHSLIHENIIEAHCNDGSHCTSFDAGCNASKRVDDHSRFCCTCGRRINPNE